MPELQGLSPDQIGQKLISEDNDPNSLGDIFHIASQFTDPATLVQTLKDKGTLTDQQITDAVLHGAFRNLDLNTTATGKPTKPVDAAQWDNIQSILKKSGITQSTINNTRKNL